MPYIGKTTDGFGVRNRFVYLASASDTSVSGADANGATLTFTDGAYVDVYLNGVLLKSGTDYNTNTANTIAGLSAMAANDEVTVVVYDVFTVADMVSATSGGTFSGNVTHNGTVTFGSTVSGLDVNGTEVILDADGDTSITADTDDQIDIKIAGADDFKFKANTLEVQTGSNIDMNGTELILDADGDSSITADTDDQIDFRVGGSDKMTLTSVGNLQLGSANDFSGIQDTLQLGDSQQFKLYHNSGGGNNVACILSTADSMQIFTDVIRVGSADNTENLFGADKNAGFFCKHNNNTGMSLTDSDGSGVQINFVANMTNTNTPANNVRGIMFEKAGGIDISCIADNLPLDINRANDGAIIRLRSAGTTEGQISISGSTTSYGAFTGTHWSRLTDNSKPNILRGTVMETIDEMCDWYSVEFDMDIKYVLDVDKIPEGKKEGDVKETLTVQRDIGLLPDGKSVGDTMTYTEDGVEYTGTILKQGDEKHTKSKVSNTEDSKRVYGVFMSWDDDDDTVNDMNIASLGTMVVRIHKDVSVLAGDLLTSNGDGTAKKQDDDIIRTKTIGKVLTNIKQETYSDGSYTVPCALYCG